MPREPERFPRVTYDEAIDIANRARSQRSAIRLRLGDDLSHRDELAVVRESTLNHGVELPTFVTHFPAEIKFFNMKTDPENPRRVLSADLILPYAGEAVGAAVREDDHELLRRRLLESPMLRELERHGVAGFADFECYLGLIESGVTPPHAGYGLGLDRLLQYIAGRRDGRDTAIAYRLGPLGGVRCG